MTIVKRLTGFAALLSVVVFRARYTLTNSVLYPVNLPGGYFIGGNTTTQCEKFEGETFQDEGLKFCEDETFWDLLDASDKLIERKVLISCDGGRKQWNTVMGPLLNPEPLGSLWLYSLPSKPVPEVSSSFFGSKKTTPPAPTKPQRVALVNYPEGHDLHPLGLKIFPSRDGSSSNVYIVNHARQRTYIEQFVMSPSSPTTITHVRTISSPYFISPNALALTSPDSFYVSNDHLFTRRLPIVGHVLPILETVFQLPFGFTSHVTLDPNPAAVQPVQSHTIVAKGIPFANGISLSYTGETVAIASTSTSAIHFYNRDPSTNALTFKERVILPFTPDNIDFDDEDRLIVAGHPDFPALVQLAKSQVPYSPSWVVAVSPRSEEPVIDAAPVPASERAPEAASSTLTTIFQSNGSLFSSSSTGIADTVSRNLYITGLYAETGFMICKPIGT